jgi:septal ring factor EnvC (AmiA/AmiB activator)
MLCLADPSAVRNSPFFGDNNLKPGFAETRSVAESVLRGGVGKINEPARRSIRRTYSRKRINRRWKRYMHSRVVRAKTVSKFEVPSNANSVSHVAMNGDIEKWRANLPWPVPSGTVSMRFGLYEVLKGINHNSNGITIETAPGIPVTAVFGGYVQSVFTVADKPVVMIRHGKYFTTYSNLSAVSVCKDDMVTTGQVLGQVAENGQLDFIISDKKDNYFDPEKWLRK